MDRQRLEYYLNIYKKGLLEDILPFWEKHAVDLEDVLGKVHADCRNMHWVAPLERRS